MDNIRHSKLEVTAFDRINGSLVSAILVVGFLFATLFAIWWSNEFQMGKTGPENLKPVKRLQLTEVSLDQTDFHLDLLPPTAAPRLRSDLAAVPDVLSTVQANVSKSFVDGLEDSEGSRDVGPIGPGGESGEPGPHCELPEPRRWSVVYQNPDFDDYVHMLEFFNIEIGVVRLNSNEIIRVKIPGNGSRVTQSTRADEKSSFYFNNTQPMSKHWDEKIVRDADVDHNDSALVHFYPEQAIQQLRSAESKKVIGEGKTVEDILTTKFIIVPIPEGFEVQIDEISYR